MEIYDIQLLLFDALKLLNSHIIHSNELPNGFHELEVRNSRTQAI